MLSTSVNFKKTRPHLDKNLLGVGEGVRRWGGGVVGAPSLKKLNNIYVTFSTGRTGCQPKNKARGSIFWGSRRNKKWQSFRILSF